LLYPQDYYLIIDNEALNHLFVYPFESFVMVIDMLKQRPLSYRQWRYDTI